MKKNSVKVFDMIIAFACLLTAAWLEVDLTYGKKQEEDQRQFEQIQKGIEQMQKANTQNNVDLKAVYQAAENKTIHTTHDFLDELYRGFREAQKKKISSTTYFIDQGKAHELKQKLQQFVRIIRSRCAETLELHAEDMLNPDNLFSEDQAMSWERHYFENVSLPLVKEHLTKIKLEMTFMEIKCK